MTLLLAIWITGAVVLGLTLWLEGAVDFREEREVAITVASCLAWPIALGFGVFERWNRWRNLLLVTLALLFPTLAFGQAPDHRGEAVLDQPAYRGVKASAPIPPSQHIRNEGGSDGAGLCVISSVLANGQYQRVPGLANGKDSALWRAAKAAPGGYYPEKLARLVAKTVPNEKYASYTGTGSEKDREFLEKVSRAGYPIGATMNTGALYRYSPIHHMVSLVHYRRNGWACVVDNNRPGFYSWMPASEWNRRWPDMGTAWMWFWTRLPATVAQGAEIGVLLCSIAFAVVLVAEVHRRTSSPALESQ